MSKILRTTVEYDGGTYLVASSVTPIKQAHTALFECDYRGNAKSKVPLFAILDKRQDRLESNHVTMILNIHNAVDGVPFAYEACKPNREEVEIADGDGVIFNSLGKAEQAKKTAPKIEKGDLVAVLPEYIKAYQAQVMVRCGKPFRDITVGLVVNVEGGMADVSWLPLGMYDLSPEMRIKVEALRKLN